MVALARLLRILPAIAAVTAMTVAGAPAGAQKVGVNSAVNPDATGTPPGGSQRKLVVGQEVVHNEHVVTGPNGQTQILFLDESAMTVGPNADVTIDEFVYDPNTGNGRLAMSATQGVMRFVGGKLSKKADAVSMTTPVGTLGIRGGTFLLDLNHNCPGGTAPSSGGCPLSLEVVFLYGDALSVTAGNVTQSITRPGFAISIARPGATPSSPAAAGAGTMQKLLGNFLAKSGATGGSTKPPTDASVAASSVPADVSNNVAGSDAQAAAASPITLVQPPNINAITAQASLNTTANNSQPSSQSPSTPPPPFPDTSGISGGVNVLGGNPAFGFDAQIAPYSGGVVQGGILTTTIINANFNLHLNLGNSFTASIPLAQGTGTLSGAGTSPLGPFSGTTFATPDNSFFFADLFLNSLPTNTIFLYGGTPVNQSAFQPTGSPQVFAFALQPDAVLQSPIPFIRDQTGGSLSNPTVSPLFLAVSPTTGFNTSPFSPSAFPKALQASLAINGQGPGQSSVLTVAVGDIFATTGNPGQLLAQPVLNGVVEGSFLSGNGTTPTLINSNLLTAIDGTGASFYGKNQISGFVLDSNSCCQANGSQIVALASESNPLNGQQVNYQFNQPAISTPLPAIGTGSQTANSLTGFAGGTMNKIAGGIATPYAAIGTTSIQTDPVNLQIAAQIAAADLLTPAVSNVHQLQLSYGSLTPGNTAGRQAFINDNLFATLESPGGAGSSLNGTPGNAQLYLVNANAVPNTTLLPNGALCQQCQFLQWGYWGGQVTTPGRNDVGAINFWVAGFQTPVAQLPTTGSGSYSGSAIGSVVNNGTTYLAAGGFNQTYNFGSQTGVVNITNFDGASYTAGVGGIHGTSQFNGTLSGPAGRSGVVAGGFFGTGTQAASETAGSFAIQSPAPGYLAGGVFAGRLTGPIH